MLFSVCVCLQFLCLQVVASIPSTVSTLVHGQEFVNLTVLRLLRLARVLRSVRTLRSLKEIIDVVKQAGKAIANLLVFSAVIYVIVAIFMMQVLTSQ